MRWSGVRWGASALACVVWMAPRAAQASDLSCDGGSIVLPDCSTRAAPDFLVGETIGVEGGTCYLCGLDEDGGASCETWAPTYDLYRDGQPLDVLWERVEDAPCAPLSTLATELEPGEYQLVLNEGVDSTTLSFSVIAGADDQADADDEADTDEQGGEQGEVPGGCHLSGQGSPPSSLLALIPLLGLRLRRARDRGQL